MYFLRLFLICFVLALTTACVGKLPAESSAQAEIARYLNHYGKKYPESFIGSEKIQKVEIYTLSFIKRGHANATAFITTESGALHQAEFTLKRAPFGWEVESWEVLNR